MGDSARQLAVLDNRAAAHPLHNPAGGLKQVRVGHADHQIAVGVPRRHIDPLNAHLAAARRGAGNGGQDLRIPQFNLLHIGHGHCGSLHFGPLGKGAIYPRQVVGLHSPQGRAAGKLALELTGGPRRAFDAAGDGDRNNLAGEQRQIGAGVTVRNGVAKPRKGIVGGVHKGQGSDACGGIPHPDARAPTSAVPILHRGQRAAVGRIVPPVNDLQCAAPCGGDGLGQFLIGAHRLAVGRDNHIPQTQPGLLGGILGSEIGMQIAERHNEGAV